MAKARRKKKRRRQTSYGALFVKTMIILLITVIMGMSGLKRMAKIATSDEYPSAQIKCQQAAAAGSGMIGTLRAVYSDTADPDDGNGERQIGNKKIPAKTPDIAQITLEGPTKNVPGAETQPETEMIEFSRPLFRGKLLKIKDPSRVYVGVAGPLGTPTSYGRQISAMVEEHGAIAAVNANGFVDPNGMGNGGMPVGIVISEGQLCFGDLFSYYDICGFDNDGKLHVGWMTGQEAMDLGIRDAACFGPCLIKDGIKQDMSSFFGGYNPRTVIGQAEDGTVMILLIEGRMFTSIGLTYPQLVDFCYELGMVNASNMDGGASSVMYYNGEQATIVSTLYGSRDMPNCWLVAPES